MPAAEKRAWASAHVWIVLAFVALFLWLFARFFLRPLYLAESDLYENGLPIFLSPIWKWSSYEFAGLPVLADPQNFDFYLPNVVFGKFLRSWTAVVMLAPLLATCFTYAYVFSVTRSRTAAIFSALAFGLSEGLLERLRHLNHVHTIAWLPLIALALDKVRGEHPRWWIGVGAFAVGSCILAGHPQPALYVMYAAGAYALTGIVAERAWRSIPAAGALFAIGILLSAAKALPLAEARNYVVRIQGLTFERFVGPSFTGPELFSFVLPTILHEPTTELPTYVGLATLLLAQVGVTRWRSNWRVGFWLVTGIVALGLALGTSTPLVSAAYYVPLYSWFRNLSRHMFLCLFALTVLAGFGMAAIQRGQITMRTLKPAAGVLAVLMIIGAVLIRLFPQSFPLEGPHGAPGPGPLAFFTVGVWIQFAMLLAVVGVCMWMVKRPSKLAPVVLMVVLVVDLLNALPYDIKRDGVEIYGLSAEGTRPSVHAEAIARLLAPTQARALAIGGTHLDDVVPATFARAWRIPIAGGYGAMIVDRLSRLASMGTNGEVRAGVLADNDATLDILAVKYIIVNGNQLEDPERQRWLRGSPRWREAMHFLTSRDTDRGTDLDFEGETDVTVFENMRAQPRAWIVEAVTPLAEREAIRTINVSQLPDGTAFDPRRMALIDPGNTPGSLHFTPGAADVRVDRIGDGEIGIRVSTAGGGFLVLSENAYPGWRARVDDVEAPIYRADVTLQGVVVPAGTHRVEFRMESRSLRVGMWVSGAAALAIALLLGGSASRGSRRSSGPAPRAN